MPCCCPSVGHKAEQGSCQHRSFLPSFPVLPTRTIWKPMFYFGRPVTWRARRPAPRPDARPRRARNMYGAGMHHAIRRRVLCRPRGALSVRRRDAARVTHRSGLYYYYAELDMLSKNQKKLLTILARENGTNQPLGKDFVQKSRTFLVDFVRKLRTLRLRNFLRSCKRSGVYQKEIRFFCLR